MGVPTQAQIESYTDRLAALTALDLAGFNDALSGATVNHLRQLLNAAGDTAVEDALGSYFSAVDEQSLPANMSAGLATVLGRGPYRNLVSALNNYLVVTGGYANFLAYLTAKSASLHPLAAELFRSVLGETTFTETAGGVLTVFPPNYQSRTPDRVYQGADGSLSEETVDAGDVGTADITLFASDDHALYIGSRYKFTHLVVALSTLANVSITPTFQYWNGNAWTTLSVTDGTSGLTKNDRLTWTAPTDWARHYKDAGGTAFADLTPLYYIRIARTENTVGTPPVGSTIRIVPSVVPTVVGGSLHLGVDQPPLALCRITAANTVAVEPIAGIDTSRFGPGTVIKARALTPIAQDLTITLSYVDQASANQTQASSAWTAPAALGEKTLSLAGSGLFSVRSTGNAVVTTATEGIYEIICVETRTPAL